MYIRSLHIETERTKSFPYNTYAVRYAKHIDMGQAVTFIVGDNGVGKSTLIEYCLQIGFAPYRQLFGLYARVL